MRKLSDIRSKILKLEEGIKIATVKLEECLRKTDLEDLDDWKRIYWEDGIASFQGQLHGILFAMGECD